ncbi:MucR family transcriptional regulator [Roseivivax halodurans JCM 10272]|uniref:MucR family transcriptional regulator n=1 Tax=Roseivivax halodurans JCM 10272 TaxID=1449350 RepID=X7EJP3_9RHOB|nr:MucR family transcriptional regulator [Roseivivax halodurans]ETX16324.1 MucR family transcriptional regulator [Roseivivax halodurans JCM 10272]
MSVKDSNEGLIAAVVASFAARPDVTPDEIVDLVRKLRREVDETAPQVDAPARDVAEPALPISQAVTRDKVYCLCCGKGFKMLKRHLGSEHGLTELQYRQMFDLPEDMPLVAPSYSERKADYAKQAEFGKHKRHTSGNLAEKTEKISS